MSVIYHAGLLCHQATTRENRKVRDAANIGSVPQASDVSRYPLSGTTALPAVTAVASCIGGRSFMDK
jgi:hypothetical protein